METKFQKFQNALPSIFGTHEVQFLSVDEVSACVRSHKTGMFCGCELVELIALAKKLDLHFYIRSYRIVNGMDCVEFVIYG